MITHANTHQGRQETNTLLKRGFARGRAEGAWFSNMHAQHLKLLMHIVYYRTT